MNGTNETNTMWSGLLVTKLLLVFLACLPWVGGTGCQGGDGGGEELLGRDADADGIPDDADNCPLTANGQQADADRDGLGDTCDAPFFTHFAYTTTGGVVASAADERGRLTRVVGPNWSLTLSWSADSSAVQLAAEERGASYPFSLQADLSDASVLAGLEDWAAQTGRDVSAFRQWVTDHPGRVSARLRGEAPAGGAAARTSASASAGKPLSPLQQNVPQDLPSSAEVYLEVLHAQLHAMNVAIRGLREQNRALPANYPPDAAVALGNAILNLENLRDRFGEYLADQMRVCQGPCTLACPVPCVSAGRGSCCVAFGATCLDDYDRDACTAVGGQFNDGFGCGEVVCGVWGACVLHFVDGLGHPMDSCSEQLEEMCMAMRGDFHFDQICAVIPSASGSCVYANAEGHGTCGDTSEARCRELGGIYEDGFFCAGGACFYDAGGATLCVHNNGIDCAGLNGQFEPDQLCNGRTSALDNH